MGIRYEKDTILNWINEMGKFLRLLIDKSENYELTLDDETFESGYTDFFQKPRSFFLTANESELRDYLETLVPEQIRPLAQLLMHDGLNSNNQSLLKNSKFLFEEYIRITNNFSFEDAGILDKLKKAIVD